MYTVQVQPLYLHTVGRESF